MSKWVARYGVLSVITTDQGVHVQFTSATWSGWCEYGMQYITTMAFHPQANGMVERLHHQMKDALCARGGTTISPGSCWASEPPPRRSQAH